MAAPCRLCLGRGSVRHGIFASPPLLAKILACLPLQISEADGLPDKICDACNLKIDDIYEYRNRAEDAQRSLLSELSRFSKENSERDNFQSDIILYKIKDEPLENFTIVENVRSDVDIFQENRVCSKYTQTDFPSIDVDRITNKNDDIVDNHAIVETVEIKKEAIGDDLIDRISRSSIEYTSVDNGFCSEDDLTLNKVITIPPVKLKIKHEYVEPLKLKIKKSKRVGKRNDLINKKKSRGRPKGSLNKKSTSKLEKVNINKKLFELEKICKPEIILKAEVDGEFDKDVSGKSKDVQKGENFAEPEIEGSKLWQCLTCFVYQKSRTSLLQHYKEHVENSVKLDNDVENNMVISEEKSDPLLTVINTKIQNYTIVKSEKLNNKPAFQCLKCFKLYSNKRSLSRHLISHQESRPYICNMCGRAYKRAYEILLHGRAHSGVKSLFCQYELCNYSTVYRGALMSHQKRHQPDFKYVCEICNKGFDVLTWFTEHKNIHTGDKPFACELCGKCFVYSRYLASHRKSVHPETNARKLVHRCEECNLEFPYRKKLQRHVAHVHGNGYNTQVLCDICGKSLSSKEHLKFHRRIHTGEKPHICRTCGKGFVKKCNLTLHERIHSGERPHVCSHCGKAFSQRSTLVIHERYHSGIRPYRCDICSKAFVAKGLLSMHQKTCTNV